MGNEVRFESLICILLYMNYEIGIGKVGEGNEQLDCFARFRSIRISILLRIVFQEQTLNIRREKNSVFHRNMRPVFI